MARFLHSLLIVGCLVILSSADTRNNKLDDLPVAKQHHIQDDNVKELLRKQVGMEVEASIVYLTMASYFGGEKANRPGFAKFFMHNAEEEFGHAQKFISYMNKRGVHLEKGSFPMQAPKNYTWGNGFEALRDALNLEGKVTIAIKKIHEAAGGDGHLTNFLEEVFLEEQVDSMRLLSGYVHNLGDMANQEDGSYNHLAEYLFDLQLQNKKDEL